MYEKLKSELGRRDISKRQLALMAGIIPQGLYGALNGQTILYPGWRKRIAEVLCISEEELFDDSPDVRRIELGITAMDNFESRFSGVKEFKPIIEAIHNVKKEVRNELERTNIR